MINPFQNDIENFFEHFQLKFLDPPKSLLGDIILEINYLENKVSNKYSFTKVGQKNQKNYDNF